MKKEYLGDGVYAEYDYIDDQIKLTSENGIIALDTIYMDSFVQSKLMHYIKRVNCDRSFDESER